MFRQSLNGVWDLRSEHLAVTGWEGYRIVKEKLSDWIPAHVPGEVHLALIDSGQMEEPLVSNHAFDCQWPEDYSWWYRYKFTPHKELLTHTYRELVFYGLDYYAQIYLNGQFLGETENTFIPHTFDVTHLLNPEGNELIVRLTTGTERAHRQKKGERTSASPYGHRQSFEGIVELRKPQFSYGWDWVERLPNVGIWRDVELRGYTDLRIFDLRHNVIPSHDFPKSVELVCDLDIRNLHPWAEHLGRIIFSLFDPQGQVVAVSERKEELIHVGITRIHETWKISKPQLWWPNGYGDQPLYTLRAEVWTRGSCQDIREFKIGLRTIQLDRSPLPQGHRFAFLINNERIFCQGANWIPADAIPARVSKEKYYKLLKHAQEAGFNILRVWGGGYYEDDYFYQLCDEFGILIWQDFMFACNPYPDQDPHFRAKIQQEAEWVVRHLRHHPSIVIWSGNNENIEGFKAWWGNSQYDYPHPHLKLGGSFLYSELLPKICLDLDPQRPYWAGSPCGGLSDPRDETEGDVHWWGPGTMNPDISRRYRHEIYDECRARFVTEYGVIGPCHLRSWQDYLHPEEISLTSEVAQLHINFFEKGTLPAAIRYHYADPENLSLQEYIIYGQLFQAVMYGRSLEALRFRKGDPQDECAGALFWMYDDCWGETGWTPIDYYLRRKPSYYWIKNAFYPVRAIVRCRNHHLITRIINDTLQSVKGTIHWGWITTDGTKQELYQKSLCVPKNSMLEVTSTPIPSTAEKPHNSWIFVAYFCADGWDVIPAIWNLVPHRQLQLSKPTIQVERKNSTMLVITSDVYAHAVACPDEGDSIFSDNYFDLIPGLPKIIHCQKIPASFTFRPSYPFFA